MWVEVVVFLRHWLPKTSCPCLGSKILLLFIHLLSFLYSFYVTLYQVSTSMSMFLYVTNHNGISLPFLYT